LYIYAVYTKCNVCGAEIETIFDDLNALQPTKVKVKCIYCKDVEVMNDSEMNKLVLRERLQDDSARRRKE